jgi:hypothetical protein
MEDKEPEDRELGMESWRTGRVPHPKMRNVGGLSFGTDHRPAAAAG